MVLTIVERGDLLTKDDGQHIVSKGEGEFLSNSQSGI